ncbi:MAG TPA: hypothetical protein IAC63_00985 [Candidatus Enterousia avicola]|uniref:Uncharacterized protein n=1 Tax=Candidatus Enterousia avicola TaxID=2840787 RepID=A0A9D1MRA0_9PROT|nr:hypothetical protein [Candidatus Enterousia avicola]
MIPYLLSIAGGIVLFKLTENNIHDPNLSDLINNIAASLLAIPLVFLLYDYSNYRVSSQLNKTMTSHITDKTNIILLNVIIITRQILDIKKKLTFTTLNQMGNMSLTKITNKLKITKKQLDDLRTYCNELDDVVNSSTKNSILTPDQIQVITGLIRDMSLLINEHNFRHNKRIAAKYIENIIGKIIDWLDSDAFAAMHFQQLLDAAELGAETSEKSSKD